MRAKSLLLGTFGLTTVIMVLAVGVGISQTSRTKVAEANGSTGVQVITTAPGRPGTLPVALINDSESTITYVVSASVGASDWGIVLCYGQACRIGTGTVTERVDVEGDQTLTVELKVIPAQDSLPGETSDVRLTATPEDGGPALEIRGLVTVSH